ncbi:MAG: N-acetylmuramoyl-L-alanine amidase [Anaerolineae bacterium]|nr:N-acetylmuramoyl-L-alanine amidase [Thermoflexales bacterium]MDW8408206.1 N-acetylmuramoyl-L-alanine amidase [Anaerolineae bacterium]
MRPTTPIAICVLPALSVLVAGLVACATDRPALSAVPLGTAHTPRPALSLDQAVQARLDALFEASGGQEGRTHNGLRPTLHAVTTAGETVTVVLRLPSSALGALDSDTLNRQVIEAVLDLPIRRVHVLALDPAEPERPPQPLHVFTPARAPETKPLLSGAEDTHLLAGDPAPKRPQSALEPASAAQGGGLGGKTVYVSAGHGWVFHPSLGWTTQRGVSNGIIEDHNNAEAVNQYLIAYLRQAGADVFPARDPALIEAEHIVNNDDGPAYSESGAWFTSALTGYLGTSYRYAVTVASITPTAVATWSAPIAASGWYPVYVWYVPAANRAPDVRYRVVHAGGQAEVVINQRVHGYTWRYVGTFYFRAGEMAQVSVSNVSSVAGRAVIADAVRLGGGRGSVMRGGVTSQKPRWEEAARYWTMVLGAPASVYDSRAGETWCGPVSPDACDDITARPRYADWEHIGTGDDAVFVSWHSNASNGSARGTVSFVYNNDPTPPYNDWTRVAGALELQAAVHNRVIEAIRNGWDASWYDYGRWQANLGEIRETRSLPAMLIEMAFHDNPLDAAQLREPRFAQLLARAVYQGIVNYFAQKDGVAPRYLPEPPQQLAVRNVGNGALAVSWEAPPTFAFGTPTDPAQRYRLYTSSDGFAWDGGRDVAGLSAVLTGYAAVQVVYVRVTAVNAGGESFPTPVLAARVGSSARILIVHGFDSLDASMRLPDGAATRMILDRMNRYNYIVQHAVAITLPFDSATRQAVASGAASPFGYRLVHWFAGMQTVRDGVLTPAEQQLIQQFLALPQRVFLISGANVAAHLAGADAAFLRDVFGAEYVADSALSYQVAPAPAGLFAGAPPFTLDDGSGPVYNASSNDVIAPLAGSASVLNYGSGSVAAVARFHAQGSQSILLAFPLEAVRSDAARAELARRVLSASGLSALPGRVFVPAVFGPEAGAPAWCNVLLNGGFESDEGWQINPTPWPAGYVSGLSYAGQRSLRAGVAFDQTDPGVLAFSSVSQTVQLPSGAPSLSVWINAATEDTNDVFYVRLRDAQWALTTLYETSLPAAGWQNLNFDLSTWAGQRITLLLGVRNDGDGLRSVAYFDEAFIPSVCPAGNP